MTESEQITLATECKRASCLKRVSQKPVGVTKLVSFNPKTSEEPDQVCRTSQRSHGGNCKRGSSGSIQASPWAWYDRGDSEPDGHSVDNCFGRFFKCFGRTAPLFADAQAMKGAAHENIDKKDYDVTDLYNTTGCWQAIARSEVFGSFTLFVISLNAIWIGVDADHNRVEDPSQAELHFKIADQLFCAFFTSELLVRFLAFHKKILCFSDAWFRFDFFLVMLMVLETWIMPIAAAGSTSGMGNLSLLKILRLLRLTRMVRLMRAVPELMTLLKGMIAALRSVAATCLLLLIFLYIFSVVFSQGHKDHENKELEARFGNIPNSMWTLLLFGVFPENLRTIAEPLRDEGNPLYVTLFLAFVALASLTIIQMLIGVLCEVVSAVAVAEKEKSVVTYVKGQLLNVFQGMDEDGSGTISKEEFSKFLEIPTAVTALEQLGVDVPNLLLLVDILLDAETAPLTTPFSAHPSATSHCSAKDNLRTSQKSQAHFRRSNIFQEANRSRNSQASVKEVNNDIPEKTPESFGKRSTDDDDDDDDDDISRNQLSQHTVEDEEPEEESELELSFTDMTEMILRLRSENFASVPDIVDLRKFIRWNSNMLQGLMADLKSRLELPRHENGDVLKSIHKKLDSLMDMEDFADHAKGSDPDLYQISNGSDTALLGQRLSSFQEVMVERSPIRSQQNTPRTSDPSFNDSRVRASLSLEMPLAFGLAKTSTHLGLSKTSSQGLGESLSPGRSPRSTALPADVPSERSIVAERLRNASPPPSQPPPFLKCKDLVDFDQPQIQGAASTDVIPCGCCSSR